jgi:hypothetical protein
MVSSIVSTRIRSLLVPLPNVAAAHTFRFVYRHVFISYLLIVPPIGEYINNSPDGQSVLPAFGELFLNEPVPTNGTLDVSDAPGFGLELNPNAGLKLFKADEMS